MSRRELSSARRHETLIVPPTPTELPEHLVATPMARGLRRLGVGTVPFSIASMFVLVAVSAAVVMTPTASPTGLANGATPSELAARDDTAVAAARQGRTSSADAHTRRWTPATDGTAAPTTTAATSTTGAPTTTTAARRPTTTTASRRPSSGTFASVPISTKVVRCEDFTLQTEAQASFDADRAGRSGLDGDGDGIACEQLPGGGTPAPVVRRIPTVVDLRHPPTRLYGVHTPNAPYAGSELDAFATAAGGKAPNTVLFFQNFSQEFPANAVSLAWSRGMLPMISFEPIVQDSNVGQPTLGEIADGAWDEYFTRWADAAKADGRPMAYRFGQEMNGNWYPWSDGRFGNAPGDFARAWRHLHDLFADRGVTNLIWVWSVNRIDNLPDKTLARVYPGDAYVDWVGVSGYLRDLPDGATPSFDFTFSATLSALRAIAPTKFVMLTEVGAGTTESNRVTWLASFFQGLLDHPEIIGFNWFNDFKSGGDWRIQYSTATSAAFAAGVGDARYGELAPIVK